MDVATLPGVWVVTIGSCFRCHGVVVVTGVDCLTDVPFNLREHTRKNFSQFNLYPRSFFGLCDGGRHVCRRIQ